MVVRGIREKTVLLRQDVWRTSLDWFYWYFEAESEEDAVYTFQFYSRVISSGGVAMTPDRGRSWKFIPSETWDRFSWEMKKGVPVRFCLGQQYLQEDLDIFLEKNPAIRRDFLCWSPRGREVELLRIGEESPEKIPILFTARHHACEMHANHVLEGIFTEILQTPNFLAKYVVFAVPFVDKDGVEEGEQGKGRVPHDHNRDYIEESIYPETISLKKLGEEKQFQVVMDFHCPGLAAEKIFIFGSEHPRIEQNIERFGELLGEVGPRWLNFTVDSNIHKFGIGYNKTYPDGIPCSRYFAGRPCARMAFSNEISYDFASGVLLTQERLREYGAGIARALLNMELR